MEIQEKSLDSTRTLLIIGFKNTEEYIDFAKNKLPLNQIQEYYTVLRTNFLFVFFYDLRDAIKYYKEFDKPGLSIRYTISKYEISRKSEECSESNFQGSINLFFNGISVDLKDSQITSTLKVQEDIREIRNCKPNLKTIVFYDIRDAKNVFKRLNDFKFEDGVIKCRWAWDLSIYQRSEYLAKTDELLKTIGGLSRETKGEQSVKRIKIEKISNKNVLINLFDRFIVENIGHIEKIFKNQN